MTLALRCIVRSVVTIQFERDGLVIAALIALLATIELLAAVTPIRRAASIDPMQTLREE